jgi:hypothetical protein
MSSGFRSLQLAESRLLDANEQLEMAMLDKELAVEEVGLPRLSWQM